MNLGSKIYIAGHNGLVGSAIVRKLKADGYYNLLTRRSSELDLRHQGAVEGFFVEHKPEYVFFAAAKVGGVLANSTYPVDFLQYNLQMQTNVMDAAHRHGVKKFMFMGSNCLYPRHANQPIKEEYLLAGKLEPTTEYYAIAKIAGIKLCQAYRIQYGCNCITVLPVNMYGEGDSYDLQTSHVMPALISKFMNAVDNNLPYVEVWGSGVARREFLYSDDLASACLHLMLNYEGHEPVNVGSSEEISIKDLAYMIKEIVGYKGEIRFDTSKPEGIMGKLLDLTKLRGLGWTHTISLKEGIKRVYKELKK